MAAAPPLTEKFEKVASEMLGLPLVQKTGIRIMLVKPSGKVNEL